MNRASSPPGARPGRAAAASLALILALAAPARAQQPPAPPSRDTVLRHDSLAAPADSTARQRADTQATRGDSVRPVPPVTPGGAFVRSLLIPGWGQARLGRNVTGGVFLLFEGIAGAMVWKANWQLEWARTRGKFVASHRQEREDWIVLLIFNHLLSGAEAYVSALLYDFPVALKAQRLPGGATGVGVSIPLR